MTKLRGEFWAMIDSDGVLTIDPSWKTADDAWSLEGWLKAPSHERQVASGCRVLRVVVEDVTKA